MEAGALFQLDKFYLGKLAWQYELSYVNHNLTPLSVLIIAWITHFVNQPTRDGETIAGCANKKDGKIRPFL